MSIVSQLRSRHRGRFVKRINLGCKLLIGEIAQEVRFDEERASSFRIHKDTRTIVTQPQGRQFHFAGVDDIRERHTLTEAILEV